MTIVSRAHLDNIGIMKTTNYTRRQNLTIYWWLSTCSGALLGAALYAQDDPWWVLPIAITFCLVTLVVGLIRLF